MILRENGFATKAIHVGQEPDPATGAVIPPISLSTTFAQESPGVHRGYDYSRAGNPTRDAYEACVASLESGAEGFAFSSGLGAQATLLELLPHDSHIVVSDDLYGGAFRLFRVREQTAGLRMTIVDFSNLAAVEAAIHPDTRLLWAETPSNPLMKILDLEKLGALAKKKGILSVCDNTFASPRIQRPFEYGFDYVLHSATKYLNGHSDVVGGVIVARERNELSSRLRFLQKAIGAVPSPFDCYLAHRGLKTLAIRIERHSENALKIAKFLESHPKVDRVLYPGLASHPQYEIAKRQMRLPGGMLTIYLKGGLAESKHFLERLKIFELAESLGGVESLIDHPAIMTHASIPAEQRAQMGIDDNLVRISVGIEEADDLLWDLEQALA